MALAELSFRDLEWIIGIRGVRSLRDFARLKRVQVAHASKVFQNIEKNLGITLFHRSTQGIRLTDAGNHLVGVCEEILIQGEKIRDLSKTSQAKQSRPLAIAGLSFIQNHLTLKSLSGIEQRFRILEMNPNLIPQYQLMSEVDLFLHLGNIKWPDTVKTLEIGAIEFHFYIHSRYYRKEFKLKDLYQTPFITPTYFFHGQYLQSTDHCPIPMHLRTAGDETTTAAQAVQLLARSEQIAFLPELVVNGSALKNEIKKLKFSELPLISETLYLSAKSDTVPQKAFAKLSEQIKKALASS